MGTSILKYHPRFKSDKNILKTVVEEMELKSFDPDDPQLNASIFDRIQQIKLSQLMSTESEELQNHKQKTPPSSSKKNGQNVQDQNVAQTQLQNGGDRTSPRSERFIAITSKNSIGRGRR